MYVRLTIQNQYFAKCLSLENTHILQGKQDVSIVRTAADVHPVLHARFRMHLEFGSILEQRLLDLKRKSLSFPQRAQFREPSGTSNV